MREGKENSLQEKGEKEVLDVRGLWNVIERLARGGNKEDAEILLELGNDPIIKQRLNELAKEGHVEGGAGLAKNSALEALESEE